MLPGCANSYNNLHAASAGTQTAIAAKPANSHLALRTEKLTRQALILYPDDPYLRHTLNTHTAQNEIETSKLLADIHISQSLWLQSLLRIENLVQINNKSLLSKWKIQKLNWQQISVNRQLIKCASAHLMADQLIITERCLSAINKDLLSAENAQKAQSLTQHLRNRQLSKPRQNLHKFAVKKNKTQSIISAPPAATSPTPFSPTPLLQALREAIQTNSINKIHSLYIQLSALDIAEEKNQALLEKAKKRVQSHVTHLSQLADALYLQEKVVEADALWQQLIILAPGRPEFQQNHERAEKIIRKIKLIKEESAH